MNIPTRATRLFLAVGLAALAAACGGGGGSGGGGGETPTPSAQALAQADFNVSANDVGGDGGTDAGGVGGSAGDGAPIKRATVLMVDATGKSVSGLTDDNGNFLITTSGMTKPIVVKVIDTAGKVLTSVLNEDLTSGIYKRVMVNPLTDKIVSDSLLAGVSGTDKEFNGSKIDVTKIDAAVSNLRASIQSALSFAGVTNTTSFNPITDKYAYDGTGVDAVIESITHKRNPANGNTVLTVKLSAGSTDANGVIQDIEISATTPLATASVLLNTSQELTYAKVNNFVNRINYCLSAASSTDTTCDVNGQFHSTNYKHSSMDFDEHFRTLLSETNREGVVGSIFKNPVILFIGKYPNSTATFNDLALVEVTIRQPRTGPLAGNIATPIEYPMYAVFKRDDSQTASAAGNWVLHGNQRNYDIGVDARYNKVTNLNPLSNFNATNGNPSFLATEIRTFANSNTFNPSTRLWTDAGIRAVRFKGPGLPAAGFVVTKSNVCGAVGYLAAHNQTGAVGTSTMVTSGSSNSYRLNAVHTDGSALYSGFFPTNTGTAGSGSSANRFAVPARTNFSDLKAFSVYTAEIFLNTNPGNSTPDAVEYTRILAPVLSPAAALNFPLNSPAPSAALVTPGTDGYVAGGNSFNVQWTNNLNSGPVVSAGVYGEQGDPKGAITSPSSSKRWSFGNSVFNAFSANIKPTSQTVTFNTDSQPDCGAGALPSLGAGTTRDYREAHIQSRNSRSRLYNFIAWNNTFNTHTVAFPTAAMPANNTLQSYQATTGSAAVSAPLSLNISVGSYSATVTLPSGSTVSTTGFFFSPFNGSSTTTFTFGSPSQNANITTSQATYFALWNFNTNVWGVNGSANAPGNLPYPDIFSLANGFNTPMAVTMRDSNGNWWAGVIHGRVFTGTFSVPLTGSTLGAPGSSSRFSVTVNFL